MCYFCGLRGCVFFFGVGEGADCFLVGSTVGRVLEKVGGVVRDRGLVEKGRGMREERRGEGTGAGMVAD